jgi:hypothetical protein
VVETSLKPGFRVLPLIVLLTVFLLGAGFIWYSLATHPAVRSRVDVLNTRQPMNVLVGVQGTPLDPGFLGFIAVVKPNSRVLTVVPISGLTPVRVDNRKEPLYQAVSDVSAAQATRLVAHVARIPINHYFYLNANDLMLILQALYQHSPNWPPHLTPLTMLETLGYPNGRIETGKEMTLLRIMVAQLPLINPIQASSLLAIPKTAVTNLTSYQLFLLANYVRGDQLHLGSLAHRAPRRRFHG